MRRCPPRRAWRRARRAAPEQHRNGAQAALPALRFSSGGTCSRLAARGLGQPAEHVEHHRLALEVIGLDLARGAVEAIPYVGYPHQAAGLGALDDDTGAEPVAYRLDERRVGPVVAAPQRVAERVQVAW